MQLDSKLFEERLKDAIKPTPLSRWCEKTGISYSTLNSAFQRKAIPNADLVAQISIALGKSVDWLLGLTNEPKRMLSYGNLLIEDQPRDIPVGEASQLDSKEDEESTWADFLQVPLYEVKASAGYGAYIDKEHVRCQLAFRRDFIRNRLGIEHTDLYCVSVDGVSMEPVLRHGHPVLIDAKVTEVLREGPYLLRLEGALLLKNLQRLPGGRLRIWSENQSSNAYQPIEIAWPPAEGTDLKIFGRVRWSDVVF